MDIILKTYKKFSFKLNEIKGLSNIDYNGSDYP